MKVRIPFWVCRSVPFVIETPFAFSLQTAFPFQSRSFTPNQFRKSHLANNVVPCRRCRRHQSGSTHPIPIRRTRRFLDSLSNHLANNGRFQGPQGSRCDVSDVYGRGKRSKGWECQVSFFPSASSLVVTGVSNGAIEREKSKLGRGNERRVEREARGKKGRIVSGSLMMMIFGRSNSSNSSSEERRQRKGTSACK